MIWVGSMIPFLEVAVHLFGGVQCLDDKKWGEDLASFFLVVSAAMVLCPIVAVVGCARALTVSELFLVITVT